MFRALTTVQPIFQVGDEKGDSWGHFRLNNGEMAHVRRRSVASRRSSWTSVTFDDSMGLNRLEEGAGEGGCAKEATVEVKGDAALEGRFANVLLDDQEKRMWDKLQSQVSLHVHRDGVIVKKARCLHEHLFVHVFLPLCSCIIGSTMAFFGTFVEDRESWGNQQFD